MKIEMTVEFPDAARRYIAALTADGAPATDMVGIVNGKGMATREACIAYMRSLIASIDESGSILPTGKLTEDEEKDAKDAIIWLRKQGKTEGQIRAWLFLQRARFDAQETVRG